jgi:hypothetical protein
VSSKKAKSKTTFDTTDDSTLKAALDPKGKSKMPLYNKGTIQKLTSTPGKTKKSGMTSTPSTSSKVLTRVQTPRTLLLVVSEPQIERFFNGGLPFSEASIDDILKPLLLGGKGKKQQTLSHTELTNKNKLYVTVIRELNLLSKKLIFEYNNCRDKSVAYETALRTKESDLIFDLRECQELLAESQNECTQLKESLITADADLFSITEQARKVKEEYSPMRNRYDLIDVYIYIHTCMYIHIFLYVYVCKHFLYTYMYIYIYICMYTYMEYMRPL